MAITRSQIAKQLLANGGRIGFFKGAQADTKAGKSMSPGTSVAGGTRSGNDNQRSDGDNEAARFVRRQMQNEA